MKRKAEAYILIINGDLFERKSELIFHHSHDYQGFDPDQLMDGTSLTSLWPQNVIISVRGHTLVDMFPGGTFEFIVSDPVREIISKKWNDAVEFLPIKVIQHESGEDFGPYWVLNVINLLDALDESNTIWGKGYPPPQDEPYPHIGIIKPALIREVIRDEGIFRISVRGHIEGPSHFITEDLRYELVEAKATKGMDFQPLKVV